MFKISNSLFENHYKLIYYDKFIVQGNPFWRVKLKHIKYYDENDIFFSI